MKLLFLFADAHENNYYYYMYLMKLFAVVDLSQNNYGLLVYQAI